MKLGLHGYQSSLQHPGDYLINRVEKEDVHSGLLWTWGAPDCLLARIQLNDYLDYFPSRQMIASATHSGSSVPLSLASGHQPNEKNSCIIISLSG